MKKNFFKKLSFVMALAMMVSMVAPAASALGATGPSLYVTTKYLYLNDEGSAKVSEYDFNIKNKVAGATYAWSSDNEDAAVVDEATGVTSAVAVGTAHVTVTVTFKDDTTKDLTATVVVRDNIETIDVKNVPATDLVVNTPYNFDRTFTTFNGSEKATSSLSRWTVDKATATIAADSGIFTATEAGEYKVTVNAFQSNAQYLAWKADPVANATLVKAFKTITVNVAASIVSTVQVNNSKFTVEFDSDMSKSDLAAKAVVAQIINGKPLTTGAEKIKKISFDATGKIATVEMYTTFLPKAVYNFTFGKLVGSFTAATTDIADVTDIAFSDFTTNVVTGAGQDMEAKIVGLNKDGVVILTGAELTAKGATIEYSYKGDLTKGYVAGKMAYIYSEGYTTTIEAKYKNYVYNSTTKAYDTVTVTRVANATGVKLNTALNTGSIQYALSNAAGITAGSTNVTWGASVTIAAKETSVIYSRFKNNDPSKSNGLDDNYTLSVGKFSYTSSNTDVLLITGSSLYAIAPGSVTVIVKDTTNNNAVVGTFDVIILAARAFASATIDQGSVTVGNFNAANVAETATVKLVTKDTMGDTFAPVVTNIEFLNSPYQSNTGLVVIAPAVAANWDNSRDITVKAQNAKAGAYNIKLTVKGFAPDGNASKEVFLTVVVVEANLNGANTVAAWKVDLTKTSVDLKNVEAAIASGIAVYGYNSANVRVAVLAASEYTVTVKLGDTTKSTNNQSFDIATVSNGAVSGIENGTYIVTASVSASGAAVTGRVAGAYIGAGSIVVSDTTTKSVGVDTLVVSGGALTAAVLEAFTFNYNGTSAETMAFAAGVSDGMTLTKVTYSKGATQLTSAATTITSNESVFISEVEWTKVDKDTNNSIVYKFTVDRTIIGK